MGSAAAEIEKNADPPGPLCAQCSLPMRLQRSESSYTASGVTVRLFRCTCCGLSDIRRLRADPA